MFLVDDVLLFPLKGSLWLFNEICKAAEEEIRGQSEEIMAQLRQIYTALEHGEIAEAEFEAREAELLDRLEGLEDKGRSITAH